MDARTAARERHLFEHVRGQIERSRNTYVGLPATAKPGAGPMIVDVLYADEMAYRTVPIAQIEWFEPARDIAWWRLHR